MQRQDESRREKNCWRWPFRRSFGQMMNDQQNRIFNNGARRPDRFPSNSYPNWVQWKSHFVIVGEANGWTDIQAINALPVCLNGHALDEYHAAPTELKRLPRETRILRYRHFSTTWSEPWESSEMTASAGASSKIWCKRKVRAFESLPGGSGAPARWCTPTWKQTNEMNSWENASSKGYQTLTYWRSYSGGQQPSLKLSNELSMWRRYQNHPESNRPNALVRLEWHRRQRLQMIILIWVKWGNSSKSIERWPI